MSEVLAFAGSARADSFNKKLVLHAAERVREAGTGVQFIDLRDYPLPLYDGDLEAADGLPENVHRLKEIFAAHRGLLLACPEYNSSITPLLKNTLDWVSRPAEGEGALAAFRGKVAGLLSASPGALGGLRGLVHVRSILGNIGVLVLPTQVAVSRAHEAFDAEGALRDKQSAKRVDGLASELAETVAKLG